MTAPKVAPVAKTVKAATPVVKPSVVTRALRSVASQEGNIVKAGDYQVTKKVTAGALRIDHSQCSHAKTKAARANCRSKVEAGLKPSTDTK